MKNSFWFRNNHTSGQFRFNFNIEITRDNTEKYDTDKILFCLRGKGLEKDMKGA